MESDRTVVSDAEGMLEAIRSHCNNLLSGQLDNETKHLATEIVVAIGECHTSLKVNADV